MKIIFISGPYTAPTKDRVEKNIQIADIYARLIASRGLGFICPHLNSRHMEDVVGCDYRFWMRMYRELLRACDAVFFLPNWETSEGSKEEHEVATENLIPAFYSTDKLFKWAKARR